MWDVRPIGGTALQAAVGNPLPRPYPPILGRDCIPARPAIEEDR